MTTGTGQDAQSSPRVLLSLTEAEASIRQAEKDKLAAKHGFQTWNDAPTDALLEFQEFLRKRMEDYQ